ncbi:MAG: DUF1015 domain-containing protein [Nocardioides sp.]|nr:DUF1015 domain-containing protein [Nocardioides sp.]
MDTKESEPAHFVLRPFRALRLAHSHVGDPMANRIFARPYRAVPARLLDWRNKRHLKLDSRPAIYVHEYTSAGVSIRGLVGTLDLAGTDESVIPHEGVRDDQVRQLAERMEEMSLNPAPIMLLHKGPQAVRDLLSETTAGEPQLVYTDRGDQLQRVWRITDPESIATLTSHFAATRALIADGHHRFAAARSLDAKHPDTGWSRTLVMLIDELDTPLQLCAIHRTIRRFGLASVEEHARTSGDHFQRHASSHQALAKLRDSLVLHDGDRWATLTPTHADRLLVAWLHEELMPAWSVGEDRLLFHHSASAAIDRAGLGLSVLLPAPTFEQVDRSARLGQLLPQKATSFQPKPHLGVLMRELRDE